VVLRLVAADGLQDWQVADWERRISDLFIQAARELDEAKRKALYGEMQKIAQEQVPLIYGINPYCSVKP